MLFRFVMVLVIFSLSLGAQVFGSKALRYTLTASVTRPANTTAYTAGQVFAADGAASYITFTNACKEKGGSGVIIRADILVESNQSTKPNLELWLFDSAAPTAKADQVALGLSNSDLEKIAGVFPLVTAGTYVGNAGSGASGNLILRGGQDTTPYTCGAASTSLFGLLVVRNAYVPISGEKVVIRLGVYR